MNTLHLSDDEMAMVRSAMRSYLNTFGHDEADVVAVVRRVLRKLDEAGRTGQEPLPRTR